MQEPLLTIVETGAYLAAAKGLLDERQRAEIVSMIAADPAAGDVLVGGGGIRKVRFGGQGRGKSGGVRVIYLFYDRRTPVFLLTIFGKNERADLSRAEVNALAKLVERIVSTYGA